MYKIIQCIGVFFNSIFYSNMPLFYCMQLYFINFCYCIVYQYMKSVQFSRSVRSNSLRAYELQHAGPPCPFPLSWWCHPTISSSVVPFPSRFQCFPASGSFSTNQFFTSGGQSTEVSASASVLPMNIQDWFPLGWTAWISLLSKGLSRVFSNTTVQKHQFFSAQLSL